MTYLINMATIRHLKRSKLIVFLVKKIVFIPLFLSILTVISGCNSSSSKDINKLQNARIKWDSHSVQFYTIHSKRICECTSEMSAKMQISVSGNLVLSAFNINSGDVISKEITDNIKTVNSLFTLIEAAIADGVSIDVIYNEEFGYPETAKIDLEQLTVDGGLYVTLSNLEIKKTLLALDDITWTLGSLDSISGPQSIIENSYISMSTNMEDLKLTGTGGCNHYSADFVLDDTNNNMTISNIISTEKTCVDPINIMQQEQLYFDTLEQIQFITFEGSVLNMAIDGDAGLHFVAGQSIDESIIENSSMDFTLFQNAKVKWANHSEQYYTIESQRSCECEEGVSSQIEISVLDNSVLSAVELGSGEAVSKEIQKEILTVDNLFSLIEEAIADGISIDVIYNEEYGYPETTKIDLEQIAVDGGLVIDLSNLVIKDSKLALDDVIWVLESFDSITGAQRVIENSHISMLINMENMQLSGTGGCNNYSATFVLDDKSHDIIISNIASDASVCNEPENIMLQEQHYFDTLKRIRFFNFYDARLNMAVSGDAGLNFVPEY